MKRQETPDMHEDGAAVILAQRSGGHLQGSEEVEDDSELPRSAKSDSPDLGEATKWIRERA